MRPLLISNIKYPLLLVHGIMRINNSRSALNVIGIDIYCHVLQPTPDPSDNSEQALSTAAIVMIVVGSYLALVIIVLVIRQCFKVS